MDGTTLDVMAMMDDGVMDRPELVMAVDVATRTICAAVLRPEKAKAVDAALLLARMMVPEPMRPGWDQVLRMSASRLPFARLVDIDRRLELVAAKPVIVPETIVIDHGRVFVSEAFTRAARTLGISVQPARPKTGSDKPHVERTFESINTLFCQHVPGYTGRDVTRRGTDVADRAVWSIGELQELLDEWVIAGWQSRPHEGLRHPFSPDRAASPNDVYAAMVAAAGYVPITLTGDDYIELLPVEWRMIGEAGIQIGYRTYNCRELRACRGQPSLDPGRGNRAEVHYDPYDVSRIWVRDTRRDCWVTVPWTHHSLVRQPFAEFTWRYARRAAAGRGVDDTNETAVAVVLAGLLARAEQGPSRERRVLARDQVVNALPTRAPLPHPATSRTTCTTSSTSGPSRRCPHRPSRSQSRKRGRWPGWSHSGCSTRSRKATPGELHRSDPILELLVDLAITGNWEVSREALGLLSSINADIGKDMWNRLHDRVQAALLTADDEQRTEVLEPLLDMFV
ncbi:DDE-type integrase/transposase/recombinase [Actinoplanes hulinensis]|uniref:DDE-type integrase/transposase/recombinase n=2 Tax=Actinoplanes hulinensis TaxID=1144547 RepID=A0ABS7B560_9ACTN|nr:DDE-type integrase/transposase/recombinase [Actinoplanes hulinensis]